MKPTRDLVLKKIDKYWPAEKAAMLAQLDLVRGNDASEETLARIQLAVLKLSRGRREELTENVELANRDPRDVLAYAEYPRQMAADHLSHFNLNDEEQKELKEIRNSDRAQYLAWLNDGLPE